MADEIRPAISRPAWKHESVELPDGTFLSTTERDGVYVWLGGRQDREFRDQERHALAALALHGQPFGFTREDVEAIHHLIDAPDWQTEPAQVQRALSLAARIAALLPPEDAA